MDNTDHINSQKKPLILVVDDDTNLLELITQVLTLHGLSCETANDGLFALEKLKTSFYSLIISDIRMPNMTGTELLKQIRKWQVNEKHKSKVILMTAYSTFDIIEHADELGVDDFFTKPFDINNFILRVNTVLERTVSNT